MSTANNAASCRAARVETMRCEAVKLLEAHAFDKAVAVLDKALQLCDDEETRELLSLDKAAAMVEMGEDGPEVRALPAILLRRRNAKHTVLAAHNLQIRAMMANDLEDSLRFGRIALEAVDDVSDELWRRKARASVLNDLGWTATSLSRFEDSIRYCRAALAAIGMTDELRRAVFIENIGYCYVLLGKAARGVRFMKKALQVFERDGHEAYRCETLLDLCNGYIETGELELARRAGRECLAIASEPRQVRNCHYLLGEIAVRRGERFEAKRHFDVLAAFYPGFIALPDLLMSFDLRKIINFKL